MKIETIFANWIAYENLSIDNKIIEDYCYRKRNEDPIGRILSNEGGWQSKDFYNKNQDEEINNLKNIINDRFKKLAKEFNYYNPDDMKIGNFWININGKNSSNNPHNHPLSVFVSVYYVKVPNNSGTITLLNPLVDYNEFILNGMIEKYNAYNSSTYNYIPKVGDLIIFPAWLFHFVEQNGTNEDRISIAFNSHYKRRIFK